MFQVNIEIIFNRKNDFNKMTTNAMRIAISVFEVTSEYMTEHNTWNT